MNHAKYWFRYLCSCLAGLILLDVAADGAAPEETEARRSDRDWWSLQVLSDVSLPDLPDAPPAWRSNPIDRYVIARLIAEGLEPNPPADRRALIRRIAYDLTGLPPTPEEVAAFVHDSDARAYEKLVDRLLSSPHYGERWGRHWLDVIRFGESRGFERNEIVRDAWPFRDYVIDSFNQDKPFDDFIVEHLAGDVIGRDRPDVEIGSAFMTIGPYDDVGNQDAVAAANTRAATVDDMVTATSGAFLGLTINCARCHDHKFDPIPTEDYYRLKAAFDGVSHGSRVLATRAEREHLDALKGPMLQKREALAKARSALEKEILDRSGAAASMDLGQRPPPSASRTEEQWVPVEARYVRMSVLSQSDNPGSGVGARMDEFEVWTGGDAPRNVALASGGAGVSGVAGAEAKDFDGAYSVELVNDGKYGARWFVGNPPVLTVTLPRIETIERAVFSHDRMTESNSPIAGLGPMVTEYEIEVSMDGVSWMKVADSTGRRPYNAALARRRALRTATGGEQVELDRLEMEIAAVDAGIRKMPALPTAWMGNYHQPDGPTRVFHGGDPMKPGAPVLPASLQVFQGGLDSYELPADAPEGERRLALARWIANDGNALTLRVLVNRVWHYHFGTGIVDTPSDFGFLGGRPTHPELLDWLAHRLLQHGWRLKDLHRDILLSQTYRQSSGFRAEAAQKDADSRLLWRFPSRRLSAEEARDTLLAVAGKLDKRQGGPGFRLYEYKQDNVATYVPLDRPGPETYRRAVYHHNARASVVDILSDLDLPDNAFAAPHRASTTTPLQTLTLLNNRFVIDMAEGLCERVSASVPGSPEESVRRAYSLAFQREPEDVEVMAGATLITTHGLRAFCRAVLNANELIYLE
ncbi:MAG: DUF1553 domain-containing protein [Verrucomicrobia bacterium]|nr:DUF1553 domain-containing protein [Verrucomicrobiota bacterium]